MVNKKREPNMMNQDELKKYCIDRLNEIEMINHYSHTPSAFVCIAAFVSFLSELAYGSNESDCKSGKRYKAFIERYLPKYKQYKKEMYSTFRCGIVHSMSLYSQLKQPRFKTKKIDLPKIVITHDLNYEKCSDVHTYTENGFNAIVLHAFDLCTEIRAAIDVMFDRNEQDNPAYNNSIEYVKYQKPIASLEK